MRIIDKCGIQNILAQMVPLPPTPSYWDISWDRAYTACEILLSLVQTHLRHSCLLQVKNVTMPNRLARYQFPGYSYNLWLWKPYMTILWAVIYDIHTWLYVEWQNCKILHIFPNMKIYCSIFGYQSSFSTNTNLFQ